MGSDYIEILVFSLLVGELLELFTIKLLLNHLDITFLRDNIVDRPPDWRYWLAKLNFRSDVAMVSPNV